MRFLGVLVLIVLLITSCQLLRAHKNEVEVIPKAKRSLHLLVAKENSPFLNREGLLFVDSEDLTPSNRGEMYRIDLHDIRNKLIICDHIVEFFEYGDLDYSKYRDWQLPYFLHLPRVCVLDATSDEPQVHFRGSQRALILLIQLLQKGIIFNHKWFNKSGIQVPDSQSLTLGRLPNNISYYSQSFVDPTTPNYLLPYLPTILSLDSDTLVTNKNLTLDDFLMRIQKGLSAGSYFPGKDVSEPIDIENVHFAMAIDGSMKRRYPLNSGNMWFRPSNTVLKLLSAAILISGSTTYKCGTQGGITHLIEHMGCRVQDLMEMFRLVHHDLPDDRLMLSCSLRNMSDLKVLDMPQNEGQYADLLQNFNREDDLNAYGIIVPGNWMNSMGCRMYGGKYNWKLGDWIVHFYSCSRTSCYGRPCTMDALEVMAKYPEYIATPPDVDWNQVLSEGIPIGGTHPSGWGTHNIFLFLFVILTIGILCFKSPLFQNRKQFPLPLS